LDCSASGRCCSRRKVKSTMISHDVIVVGGGLAGLPAAIESSKYADTAIISRVHPLRSHTGAAQGGINAALANMESNRDDNWEKHAYDTIKGSDFLADQDAVEILTKDAPERIIEMEHWGCPFSRTEDGKIAQRPFGGAGYPRTCYAADKTGHYLLVTAYEQTLKQKIQVYEEWFAVSLIINRGTVNGVVAYDILTGDLEAFKAKAVILATGGAGWTYAKSTNSMINTGSGMAMAYRAGVALKDMEFVQFHPTALYPTCVLITEGARGEGGYLVNSRGDRFMQTYAPEAMELAPRDIVSRSIQKEIDAGRGINNHYVHLDIRHLGRQRILSRLPGIRDISMDFAEIDPIQKPIPVQPAQHYTMGGIDCNAKCETTIKGLYAAGECACISVHGANRLGGNSLLDTIVFGKIAGEQAGTYTKGISGAEANETLVSDSLEAQKKRVQQLVQGNGDEDPSVLREQMRSMMVDNVFLFRDKNGLEEASARVSEFKNRYRHLRPITGSKVYNLDLIRAIELEEMLDLSQAMVCSALNREESRGSHVRLDFPNRDDAKFLKHTLAYTSPDLPRIALSDVRITRYQPEERKY
jgi:succinate dehydrogenase / fumarate reductase flavoprotein subunit